MRERKTSRVLNDESYFLGLSYTDISGAGIFLLGLMLLFKALEIKNTIWALMISVTVSGLLIPSRMACRRKIIRDSFQYLFKSGVTYVSKNRRNK